MEYLKLIILNKTNEFPEKYYNDNFNFYGYGYFSIYYNISTDYFLKRKIHYYLANYNELQLIIRRIKINKIRNKKYIYTTLDIILFYIYENFNQITYTVS